MQLMNVINTRSFACVSRLLKKKWLSLSDLVSTGVYKMLGSRLKYDTEFYIWLYSAAINETIKNYV